MTENIKNRNFDKNIKLLNEIKNYRDYSNYHYIIFEVLKKSILDFLAIEEAHVNRGNEIKILALEKSFEHCINIPELDFPVKLIGIVDRMDQFNGALRIIDYKTGLILPKQLRIQDWKALRGDTDLAYLFQILIYSYVHADTISRYSESYAGIISFRNLPEYFMPFELKIDHSHALSNDNLNNFKMVLFELMREIFNSRIPFKANI